MRSAELSATALLKWAVAFAVAQWLALPVTSQEAFTTLALFTAVDLITGLWVAVVTGRLSSTIGFRGITAKLAVFPFLYFCHLMEARMHVELNLELAGAIAYSFNEAVSVLENFNNLGVKVSPGLVRVLLAAKSIREKPATAAELAALHDEKEPEVKTHVQNGSPQ